MAQQLGGEKEYNIRNHITPYLKGKKTGPISDWFVSKDGKIVFKSEHLSEYKAALDERKGKATQPTQKPIQLKNMLEHAATADGLGDRYNIGNNIAELYKLIIP